MDDNEENQFQPPERDDHGPSLQDKEKVQGSGSSTLVPIDGKRVLNKLLIKYLKRRKANKKNGESSIRNSGMLIRFCNVCNKGFTSGKALGGHARIHMQSNKDRLSQTIQNSKLKINGLKLKEHPTGLSTMGIGRQCDTKDVGNQITEGKPTCPVCNKDFLSMKSLFGHMRCHPEREWRGIQPPPPPAKSSSCSTVSDAVEPETKNQIDSTMTTIEPALDLSKIQSSWSFTGKRGRKRISSTSSDGQVYNAASILMMLAQGDSHNFVLSDKHIIEKYEGKNCNFISNNIEVEDENQASYMAYKKQKLMEESLFGGFSSEKMDEDEEKALFETGFNSESENMNLECENTSSPGEKHENKTEEVALTPDGYKCSSCEKSFPTHQALGGHRSSHNKNKNKAINEFAIPIFYVDESEEGEGSGSKPVLPVHQCKICNETFTTGQALGGHKRRHWRRPNEALVSEGEASPGEASRTAGPKVPDFDLNELPVMDDEEVGVESAFFSQA
ncbi:hypothetical protein L1049_017813 [Liquidambar formosana]|uniref:C2H2-type domain-containing protein n=1 Tax=Liquidambar formosana TaxID=63359 RepID=A0AAP0NJC5_LIQFO